MLATLSSLYFNAGDLVFSIVLTAVVYSIFPLSIALIRRKPITKKKYRRLCYGFNIIGLAFFTIVSPPASPAPYVLWTLISSGLCRNILDKKDILYDSILPTPTKTIKRCVTCNSIVDENVDICPQCNNTSFVFIQHTDNQ